MSAEPASAELPRYRCHKEVRAAKIAEKFLINNAVGWHLVLSNGGSAEVGIDYALRVGNQDPVGGYYVLYDDNFASWSPAKAFEDGYTLIEPPAELGESTTGPVGVTHKPDTSLRFVMRKIGVGEGAHTARILQQLFLPNDWSTHDEEWRDVPVAEGV